MVSSALSQLTLVVPTYQRQDFALRLMNYWSKRGPKLIVIDGSDNPIKPDYFRKISARVTYIHNPSGFLERLKQSIQYIKTKYVILAGDDEFFVPSALRQCVEHLKKNDELVACIGQCLGFAHKDGVVTGYSRYPKLRNLRLFELDPKKRVIGHMCNYVPSLSYSVCRSNYWKIAIQTITKQEFPVFAIGEIQFEILMSYAGKSMAIPELMWLRSEECKPTRGTSPSLVTENQLSVWWANQKNTKVKKNLIKNTAIGLRQAGYKGNNNAKIFVKEAFEEFIKNNKKKTRIRAIISKCTQKFKLIKKILLFLKIKNLINTPLAESGKIMTKKGVKVNKKELLQIQKIIISFHASKKYKFIGL